MGIIKNSTEWNMMRDFYKLYELEQESGITNDEQERMLDAVQNFERNYVAVPLAQKLCDVVSVDYLNKIREGKHLI